MTFISDPSSQTNQLPVSVEFPRDLPKFIETLTILYKRIAQTVNGKEGGLFSAQEYINSDRYNLNDPATFKTVYRKCFDMVDVAGVNTPIPPGSTRTKAHGIPSTELVETVHIYGSAKNSDAPVKFIPLPYVSATVLTDQVQIYVTPTDVVLVNGATQTTLTIATVVVEFLKQA